MNKTIIGIDPGISGGIAVYDPSSPLRNTEVYKMPETPVDMLDLFKKIVQQNAANEVIAYQELVHGMPGQGGAAMFSFGEIYGILRCALAANLIRTEVVSPQRWMKALGIGTRESIKDRDNKDKATIARELAQAKKEWKAKLKAKAQQLYPNITVTLWNADALLILDYGMKQEFKTSIRESDVFKDKPKAFNAIYGLDL